MRHSARTSARVSSRALSTPVADLPVVQAPVVTTLNTRDNEHLTAAKGSSNAKDPVIQKKRGTGPLSAPLASFDGICLPFGPPCAEASSCSCLPPDTNGAAGATQYVQMVNSDFAVYSKTGAVLRHATPIKDLWSGVGGECAAHNDGDPVVVYDQYAGRWLLSEFVAQPATGESYGECVALSQTSDATGAYNLYFFDFGPDTFLDYPHFGVWRDGYYMSANEFPTGQETSSGAAAIVYERDKMLAGAAGALRVVRRGGGEPGRRPVHRPAAGGRRRLEAPARRRAERVRRGRRPGERAAARLATAASTCGCGTSTSTGRTRRPRRSGTTGSRARRCRSRPSCGRSAPTATATARYRRAARKGSTCSATG